MKPFFRSIWPGHTPSQFDQADHIAILRERILQYFLLMAFSFVILAFILAIPNFLQQQRWPAIAVLTLSILFFSVITFVRKLPYRIRAAITVAIFYVIGAGALLLYGLNGNGPILLAGFVALCAFFLGTAPGVGAGVIAVGTMGVVGFLSVRNPFVYSRIMLETNPYGPAEWLNRGLVVGLMGAFFTIALAILMNGLRQTLVSEHETSQQIKRERDSLEEQVTLRTREVERRATALETASSIAQQIAQYADLDQLLANAVNLIQSQYHLYYAGIFMLDENKEFAVLRSGSGEAGQAMVAMNHRLKSGETSIVGYVLLQKEPRISLDVTQDPIHFENPLLPDTRSEMAIPLISGGELIGVLDVQSDQDSFFTPDHIQALKITADQMAVAIDKAGLIASLSRTVEELQDSYRQSTRKAWQGFARTSRASLAYRHHQGQLEVATPLPGEIDPALVSGKTTISLKEDPATGAPFSLISLPIKLRQEGIGVLHIRYESKQVPGNFVVLLEAVAQRLALALENARLMEENQMRVSREHMVSEISAKVRAETEIDRVLQTVASELGRSLGVTDVLVQLRSASETGEVT